MSARAWDIGSGRYLTLDVPRIMAIINVTPDSFSDGGEAFTVDAALVKMRRAVDEGADLLDIGGESTRPGAQPVDADEQIRRVTPVIRAARAAGIMAPISADTTIASVAEAALDAGADIINDVSAGRDDPRMFALASGRACGLILMHRRSPPPTDVHSHQHGAPPAYAPERGGVVGIVRDFLAERAAAAERAGVAHDRIVIDPGLGFGKSVAQNLGLIRAFPEFESLGYPVLSAASRKSFIGKLTGVDDPRERIAGSLAITVMHALMGVRLFRVHDVAPHAQALRMVQAMPGPGG